LTSVEFTSGKTIRFGSFEFIADRFGDLSLSPEGNDSGVIFVGMIHSGSPPLCTILEESIDEDNTTSNGRGSSNLPIPQGCNVVTPTTPITTAPSTENTLTLLTTPTVPLQTSIPEPYTGHPPDRLEAYQEEQQACAHTQQAYIERRAAHQ
jgi:hypothetical protein